MSGVHRLLRTRQDFLDSSGVLLVLREPLAASAPVKGQPAMVAANPLEGLEILLSVWNDGRVVALNGHVDLGTGIRTALAQIVAEELDVAVTQVEVVLGDTGRAPNQGPTIASTSIQLHSEPLRRAAAQARAHLLELAAKYLNVQSVDQLTVSQGVVIGEIAQQRVSVSYAQLLKQQHIRLLLELQTPVKRAEDYSVVGKSIPRVDIPGKATGQLTFVHDMRMPGMLHGRVVRPPYAGVDHGEFVGNLLESVDEKSIAHIPGIRAVVVIRDFIGVVAEREEHAELAAKLLRVNWKAWPGLPDVSQLENALRNNPATPRKLVEEGDVDQALSQAEQALARTYIWPYQMHASIGPSCAVAQWNTEVTEQPYRLSVWAGTQNPHVLRADLARLSGLKDYEIEIVRMEASGCYGRNGADDVAADALLLSRAVGAPVRVQLTREQENLWEPKGAAQLMDVRGGLTPDGAIAAYDFSTSYPSNGAPTLALLLTRTIEPEAVTYEMGDRTARPPYSIDNLRVTVNDMPPILRASWLRGVSALPNSFAHESYIDELATAAGVDPLEFRLRYLDDPRARALLQATADKASWQAHTVPQQLQTQGDILSGQGLAYARYIHSKWPGFGAAWSAWVADVDVNRKTGEVHVKRVVVGHDAGMTINPKGVEHQVHGNVVQTTSRALHESVRTDVVTHAIESRDFGSYPILSFREVPVIEVLQMPRPNEPALGAGESASVPGTAAIANAIFDATGVRFRQPPFTAEVIRAALNPLTDESTVTKPRPQPALGVAASATLPAEAALPRRRSLWVRAGLLSLGLVSFAGAMLGWRSVIAPVVRPIAATYSDETIARGKLLADIGNCVSCHTTQGSKPFSGGFAMQTSFGVVYGSNLTPDPETGIGNWSLAAFERAMRHGISRDGTYLYPAFPYTSFARLTDDDITALYAYLMTQEPVHRVSEETKLPFPFNVRPLMALWNAAFLNPTPLVTNPSQRSEQWLRGEYLVNAPGHCTYCHTPRNAIAAEAIGQSFMSGAMVKGWEAPALTALSKAPVPWSETDFFNYLQSGFSPHHGSASGPMSTVVQQLSTVPEQDLRAMAHYLASYQTSKLDEVSSSTLAKEVVAQAALGAPTLTGSAQRMFTMACAACHHDGQGPKLLGVNIPLALNTNLHSDKPDNVIRVILEGVRDPASRDIGFMPAFGEYLQTSEIAGLVRYMRARYAPDKPAWSNLESQIETMRQVTVTP